MHGGEEEQEDGGITLQAAMLASANRRVAALRHDRLDLFALALFWAVLMDQAVYTYGREWYPGFRAVTRFPKLRGSCPGGCGGHLNPIVGLAATGRHMRRGERIPGPSSQRLSAIAETMRWASDYLGTLECAGVLPAGGEIWGRILADEDMPIGG